MKKRTGFVSNSSSSSFICHTDMSLDEVNDKLVILLDFYNEFDERTLSFDDVFSEPFIASKEYASSDWAKHYPEMADSEGKIVIEGACDNSIPWTLFDFIEDKFEATRCHLG
jgi:hypothetical protein